MSDPAPAAPRGAVAVLAARRATAADLLGAFGGGLLVLLLALSGGGFFPVEFLTAGIAALLGGAVLLVVRGADGAAGGRPSRHGLIAVAALVGLAGWTGLSARWSPLPDVAVSEMQRQLAYAAILVFGLLAVGSGRRAPWVPTAIWAVLVTIGLLGAASRLLPGLDLAPLREQPFGLYRLSWPISYWNAQGTAAAMAIVLSLAVAADRRAQVVLRGVAAATVPVLGVTLLLTVSRGGIVALTVGVATLLLLARRPVQMLAIVAACGVPAGIAVARAAAEPAVVEDPRALPALADVGPRLVVELLLLGLVAAVVALAVLAAFGRTERGRDPRHAVGPSAVRRWIAVVVVVGLGLTLTGAVAASGRLDAHATDGLGVVRSFVDRQQRAFLAAAPPAGAGLNRLTTAGGSRIDLYRVAWRGFMADPLLGDGVGGFRTRWLTERTSSERVQNAHSLPLETLAELGLPGFLLLAAAIAAIAVGAVRGRLRPTIMSRSLAAGTAAAIAAFLASCLIDWTWQMGALTAAALLLAAPLLPDGRRADPAAE